jgi:NAD(P)-dependent dehydrogenase (short-subunit alcohol dehydrogenase family)
MNITGKTALVTGGQRRLGRAIAIGMAKAGANVVVAHYEEDDLANSAVEEIKSIGVESISIKVDVSNKLSVISSAKKALKYFGVIDILVNSSSVYKKVPIPNEDTTNWEMSLGVILNGPFYMTNAFVPAMMDKGEGVIINICDLSVWEPWPMYSGHCVAKAGLWALTRQLALELAPKVRVNAIAPGPMIPPVDYDQAKILRTADKTLLNRWGDPEDIQRTVHYIVETNYLTGVIIPVDGGQRFGHRKYEEG